MKVTVARLAGGERDAAEADECRRRPRHRRHLVASRRAARPRRPLDRPCSSPSTDTRHRLGRGSGADLEAAVGERRVREAVAEREQREWSVRRCSRRQNCERPPPGAVHRVHRHLADVARHGDRAAVRAGLTCPKSTSAMALPPSSPGSQACTTAATFSAIHGSASTRPPMSTTTVGVPVATIASTSSCCTPVSAEVAGIPRLADGRMRHQARLAADEHERDDRTLGGDAPRPRCPIDRRP